MTIPAGRDPMGDESKQPPDTSTSLAIERTFLAFERTLMAWLRTSLSLISFGFTLAKFFQYVESQRGSPIVGRFGNTWSPTMVGIAMVMIGTGALLAAVVQHRRRVRALPREYLLSQWNLAYWVAVVVAALGVFALGSLVMGT
ncbi:YidH family protein [Paraburkholderia terrae]